MREVSNKIPHLRCLYTEIYIYISFSLTVIFSYVVVIGGSNETLLRTCAAKAGLMFSWKLSSLFRYMNIRKKLRSIQHSTPVYYSERIKKLSHYSVISICIHSYIFVYIFIYYSIL